MCGAAVHFVLINNKRPNGQWTGLCVCFATALEKITTAKFQINSPDAVKQIRTNLITFLNGQSEETLMRIFARLLDVVRSCTFSGG